MGLASNRLLVCSDWLSPAYIEAIGSLAYEGLENNKSECRYAKEVINFYKLDKVSGVFK